MNSRIFFQLAGMLLLKSIWQYDSARSPYFAPYFRTVFRNHVIQLYRYEQRQKAYIRCVSYDDEKFNRRHALISESGTPYLRDMISDLVISRDSLSSFLDDLSVYERVCFNKFQQGHSIRFIAQQLNQTEKQINDALVRCRNKLRRNLK